MGQENVMVKITTSCQGNIHAVDPANPFFNPFSAAPLAAIVLGHFSGHFTRVLIQFKWVMILFSLP
jgi:hypothetical protein